MFGRQKRDDTPIIPPAQTFGGSRFAPKSPDEALKPSSAPPPPPAAPRVRRPRGGLLSMLSGALTLGLVVAAFITFGVLVLERQAETPGPLPQDKVVLVPKNSGTSEIAELLLREGVIAQPSLFELYAWMNRGKGLLKAGEFQFRAGTNVEQVIDTLINGKAIQHAFTVPEGLTSEQIVARLRDTDLLSGNVNEVPREGTLLPETYLFERGTSRQQIVNKMQTDAREALARAWNKRSPDLPIKTPQELVILASIVEKETGRADERPRVASVFLNRLQRRMKLQSDPTIVYGIVGGKGTLGRGILRSEIERATPYNTYAIEGLPPTPIANPGRAALDAVANPLKTRDLFFVADGTGGHVFADTLDQHNRNVARWRQIERDRDAAGSAEIDRSDVATDGGGRSANMAAEPRTSGSTVPGRAFDAVEGTNRDPLRSQGWDLSSPKTVTGVAPEAPAAAAPRRDTRRTNERRERSTGADRPASAIQ